MIFEYDIENSGIQGYEAYKKMILAFQGKFLFR